MAPSKVPKFGGWEAEEDVGYTVRFETVRKGNKPGGPIINPNDLQPNQFASPPVAAPATPPRQTKPKPKQPEFGAWGEDEEVPYTQYFENRGKVKTGPSEPQMNYNVVSNQPPKANPVVKANEALPRQANTNTRPDDVHRPNGGRGMSSADPRAQPQGVKFINSESNGRQSPLHPGAAGRGRGTTPLDNNRGAPVGTRQRVHATAGPSPGRGGASVPVFGDWEKNPAQANGYTVMFNKLQDERNGVAPVAMTPTHPRYSSGRPTEPKQGGGCFSCLFG